MSFRSHSPLALLLVPFVPALASAQSQAPAGQAPAAPTQARYAGTFHAAVGQWTRPTASAARGVGPDIIYVNTAPSGYFSTIGSPSGFGAGGTILDEGGLPGTTNGTPFAGMPDRDSYLVNSFQLGYCDLGPAGGSAWEISFYDAYVPATSDRTPEATVNVSGLPAGGGCWIIDIDLTGGMEFCLGADGGEADPGWNDDPSRDSFGWSYRYTGAGMTAGMLLTGDPEMTDPGWMPGDLPTSGGGTYYGGPGGGTGYLTQDLFFLDNVATPGAFFFGGYPGNPYASMHMVMRADTASCDAESTAIGDVYCTSLPNSTGQNGRLRVLGSDVVDENSARLVADQLPPNSMGYFLGAEAPGNVLMPHGSQGVLCLGGAIGRFVRPGQPMMSDASGEISMITKDGLWGLDRLPRPDENYAAMVGTTNYFQLWHRDMAGGTPTSNFTDAMSVLWR
ncbi:MAG: hypothetical protein AAF957_24035 [Planctomycetota bacterium]